MPNQSIQPEQETAITNQPASQEKSVQLVSPVVPLPEPSKIPMPPAELVTANVNIINFSFQPAEITIPLGATVVWEQFDSVRHNVNADGLFNGPLLDEGETYQFKFEKAGVFEYYCGPHPFMKGKIIVK